MRHEEVFGNAQQQQVQQRAAFLWPLLKDQPRFTCYGRGVGLPSAADYDLEVALALVGLQGICSIQHAERAVSGDIRAELQDAGLTLDSYVSWEGEDAAVTAAREVLDERALSGDLTVREVDAATGAEDLARLDDLATQCEMLLPMGSFLRGEQRPSCFLFAQDGAGRVVGLAGSVAANHPDHPGGDRPWWGLLGTHPDRRGEGIAMILGAMAIVRMHERFGYRAFMTGIRTGNTPSEALCSKLGFAGTSREILVAIDPTQLAGGRITK